jgi:serine/threonine protein kinase
MFDSYHSKQPELSIDSFEIIKKLGEGKFASVFMAVEKITGFIVALKVVEKKRIIEKNFLAQFIREIKIQAYLDHANIARIYGFFHDESYFYSILEMGEDGQLYDIIKNGQTLSEESTSFIVGNLLDAISYIHDKKILHRDIKPENIVLVHVIIF